MRVSQGFMLAGTESAVADDRDIVQVEWRPLAPMDSFDSLRSLGTVTVRYTDGITEVLDQLTRADTAKLAANVFGTTPTHVSLGGRNVRWVRVPWDKEHRSVG